MEGTDASIIDEKLAEVVKRDIFWVDLINAVQHHYANLIGIDPTTSPINLTGTERTLGWAINTMASTFASPGLLFDLI